MTTTIRTMTALESDLDANRVNRFANLTAQAIDAGNASDAGSFARSLAHVALAAQELDADEAETAVFWAGLKARDQGHRDRFEAMMAGVRS